MSTPETAKHQILYEVPAGKVPSAFFDAGGLGTSLLVMMANAADSFPPEMMKGHKQRQNAVMQLDQQGVARCKEDLATFCQEMKFDVPVEQISCLIVSVGTDLKIAINMLLPIPESLGYATHAVTVAIPESLRDQQAMSAPGFEISKQEVDAIHRMLQSVRLVVGLTTTPQTFH